MAGAKRPLLRGDTSRGVHVRALHALLCDYLADRIATGPATGGAVALRNHIAALERTYPRELGVYDTDIAQDLAEEDGLPVEP